MSEVESVLVRLTGDWELVSNREDVICDEFVQKYNLGEYELGTIALLTIKKSKKGLIHFKYITDSCDDSFWIWSDEPILKSYFDSDQSDNTMYEDLVNIIQKLSPKREPFRADIYLTEIPFSCSGKESMTFINMK